VLNLLGRVANTRGFVLASVSVFNATINTALKVMISFGFYFAVSRAVTAILAGQNAINTATDTVRNVTTETAMIPWLGDITLYATEMFKIPLPLRDFFISLTLPINEQNWINEITLLLLAIIVSLTFFATFGARYTVTGIKWIAKKSATVALIIFVASILVLILDYYVLRTGLQSVYVDWTPFY
jgi:hypothetical protein